MTIATLLILAASEAADGAPATAIGAAGLALQAVFLLLLTAASAACSGSETVLFSLSAEQLERHASSDNPLRRRAARLMKDPRGVLMNLLLMNTAVNVLFFANSYVLFHGLAQSVGAWITPVSGVLSVLLVVVFGEVTPKVLAVSFAERVAPYAAALVHVAGFVATPIARLIDVVLVEPLARVILGSPRGAERSPRELSTTDLKALLETSRRDGAVNPLEDMYLREVIDLREVSVHDVMIARVDMVAYDVNASPEGLRELMRGTRFKKVPVYEKTIDNIVGLVPAKVLFFEPSRPLREMVSPVRFVPDLINAEQLLQHFRNTKSQIAIVVDEFGGVAGLVTLEDVIEQIVGEIRRPDEAAAEPEVVQVSADEYEVSGRLSVRYWAELFGLKEVSDRVGTVGGAVAERLGRTLRAGDVARIGNLELCVTRMKGRRAERLRLRRLGEQASAGESAS